MGSSRLTFLRRPDGICLDGMLRNQPKVMPEEPERGVFTLLGVDATDDEIDAAVRALLGLPDDYDIDAEDGAVKSDPDPPRNEHGRWKRRGVT